MTTWNNISPPSTTWAELAGLGALLTESGLEILTEDGRPILVEGGTDWSEIAAILSAWSSIAAPSTSWGNVTPPLTIWSIVP